MCCTQVVYRAMLTGVKLVEALNAGGRAVGAECLSTTHEDDLQDMLVSYSRQQCGTDQLRMRTMHRSEQQ